MRTLAILVLVLAPAIARAQSAPSDAPSETRVPEPPEAAAEAGLDEEEDGGPIIEEEEEEDEEDEDRLPILSSPTARRGEEEEPSITEIEERMLPTLVLPEWRIRAGGGVSIATSGSELLYGRGTLEVEWQPPALEFLQFGIGGGFAIASQWIVQAGARVGGYTWFCEDSLVRCQGAIDIQLGVTTGSIGTYFDLSADLDLRLLFGSIELFARGGFFSVFGIGSWVNITAGLAVAF